MRKLLLASIAVLGVTGVAQAQTALVTNPVPAGQTGPFASPTPVLAPGQIAVRLNGRYAFYYGLAANGDSHSQYQKLASTKMASFMRLYPGFDGVAANGLKYGAAVEIRQDLGGAAEATASATTMSGRGGMYVRRSSGYIAGDAWGKIQFGSNDGPITSMGGIGQFTNLGDSSFCGDTMLGGFNATSAGGWPFLSCSGNMYTTTKIAYYTPQFAGFDFGISYEPGTGNVAGAGECNAAALAAGGCDSQSSSSGSGAYKRRMNTMDMALRYRGVLGGVGIAAVGGYTFGGHVRGTNGAGVPGAGTNGTVNGLSVGYGGATITYAGITVGGAVQGGDQNNNALNYEGARDQFSWVIGASYTTGPVMVGISYFDSKRAGAWHTQSAGSANRTRQDRGAYASLNYGIAPGLSAIIAYGWLESEQPGLDVNAVRSGTQSAATYQQLIGGLNFRW